MASLNCGTVFWFGIIVLIASGNEAKSLRNKLAGRRIETESLTENNMTATKTRGMVLCSGEHMIHDAIAVADQTRGLFKSHMSITVAHCGELSELSVSLLEGLSINVLDICLPLNGAEKVLGMDLAFAHKRLKSWFCKTAALILSPYDETIVSDLDVVWLKQPDVIFNSETYKRTGSLFFRDKLTHAVNAKDKGNRNFQNIMEDFMILEGEFNITQEIAQEQLESNGFSFFWLNTADRTRAAYDNFQDSSVIVMDTTRHPKTLDVLTRLLPDFRLGYGDKEIYWFAATIARVRKLLS